MITQNKNTVIETRPEGIYSGFIKSLILVLLPVILFTFTGISIAEKIPNRGLPFKSGEKLTYKVTWGIIPAGEITLEVFPKEIFNGIEVYHFVMTAKTSELVDLVYKIRERQDSYVDANMTRSIFYKKKTESQHPRDENIIFNWEKMESTYTNFGQSNPPMRILPGTFDPLATFYALRSRNLKENSVISVPVTDGNKVSVEFAVNIGKRDAIESWGKMYDTIEVTPNMAMVNKLREKKDNPQLKAWVTADEKKVPLRIRARVGILMFDLELSPSE